MIKKMYILGPVSARLFRKKALMAIYGSKKDLILCPLSDNDEDDDDDVDDESSGPLSLWGKRKETQRSAPPPSVDCGYVAADRTNHFMMRMLCSVTLCWLQTSTVVVISKFQASAFNVGYIFWANRAHNVVPL